MKKQIDELIRVVQNADELPEAVEGAINDLVARAGVHAVPWYKALFFKNGKFSKTAMFASIGNVLVIASFVLGWFQGTVIGPWTIPAFDAQAAGALLLIVNGTYVVNRLAANRENGNG